MREPKLRQFVNRALFALALPMTLMVHGAYASPAPLRAERSAEQELKERLRPGLTELFDGQLSAKDSETILSEALSFHASFQQHLARIPQALQQLKIKRKDAQLVRFSLPSLMERPGHPASELKGEIYTPIEPNGCYQNYPATLMLHHVGDDITPEQRLAKIAASSRRGIVMVIYLPDYGPRKSGTEGFIVNDLEKFRAKMLQALLDTRLAYEVLKLQPQVDTKNMKLMGLSLGGIIGLISAGIDPVFQSYGILVGSADIAHVMAFRKEADPDSETSVALRDIHWTVDEARRKLAHLDALVWAGNTRGKKIIMMNAEKDELIDRRRGVEKIVSIFRANGNDVKVRFHPGGHRPTRRDLGIRGLIKFIYLPTMSFFSEGSSRQCAELM